MFFCVRKIYKNFAYFFKIFDLLNCKLRFLRRNRDILESSAIITTVTVMLKHTETFKIAKFIFRLTQYYEHRPVNFKKYCCSETRTEKY